MAAVRLGPQPKQPNLIVREIGAMRSALYAAPSYLAARRRTAFRAGLRGHSVIGYTGPLATSEVTRWFDAQAREAEVIFRASTVRATYDAVAAGIGIGVLPCALADPVLTRIRPGSMTSSRIWTVVHEDLNRSARVRAVLGFIRDVIRESEWTDPPRTRG